MTISTDKLIVKQILDFEFRQCQKYTFSHVAYRGPTTMRSMHVQPETHQIPLQGHGELLSPFLNVHTLFGVPYRQ